MTARPGKWVQMCMSVCVRESICECMVLFMHVFHVVCVCMYMYKCIYVWMCKVYASLYECGVDVNAWSVGVDMVHVYCVM